MSEKLLDQIYNKIFEVRARAKETADCKLGDIAWDYHSLVSLAVAISQDKIVVYYTCSQCGRDFDQDGRCLNEAHS
ncbi:MAG: hypothetical protein K0R66_1731 [Gammaproteobacteria bacterium]|nr:hypothetical protein [Gammaproteobacteria bacterium]